MVEQKQGTIRAEMEKLRQQLRDAGHGEMSEIDEAMFFAGGVAIVCAMVRGGDLGDLNAELGVMAEAAQAIEKARTSK